MIQRTLGVMIILVGLSCAVLLAYLAYHSHRSHPREELIEFLWPESDPRAGSVSFRTALASLRRQLEPPDIPPGPGIPGIRPPPG